jgi:phage virion morphogenesis protein
VSAGLQIQVQGLSELDRRLTQLAYMDFKELLESVGALVESQMKRRLQSEKNSPDGEPWADWSPDYAGRMHGHPPHKHPNQLRKAGRHSLLVLEGDLLDSIMYEVTKDEVVIGSPLIYARTHQEGRGAIPARPYLGLSHENRDEVLDVVTTFLDEVWWS